MFFIAQVVMFVDLNPIELYRIERKLAGSHYSKLSPRLQKNKRYLLGNPHERDRSSRLSTSQNFRKCHDKSGKAGLTLTTRCHTNNQEQRPPGPEASGVNIKPLSKEVQNYFILRHFLFLHDFLFNNNFKPAAKSSLLWYPLLVTFRVWHFCTSFTDMNLPPSILSNNWVGNT